MRVPPDTHRRAWTEEQLGLEPVPRRGRSARRVSSQCDSPRQAHRHCVLPISFKRPVRAGGRVVLQAAVTAAVGMFKCYGVLCRLSPMDYSALSATRVGRVVLT